MEMAPGAGDLRAPQLRNEWTWPPAGGCLGNLQLPHKDDLSATLTKSLFSFAVICFAGTASLCMFFCALPFALHGVACFTLVCIACIALHCIALLALRSFTLLCFVLLRFVLF